jgi:small subunit ribosomal protein S16
MLVIRLQRTGRENTPSYRLVVSEKARHAKKGTLEILGHFLPNMKEPVFKFEKERIVYWISKGAAPSDTVSRLLKRAGVDGMEKFMVRYAKQKSKKEVKVEEKKAPAAAEPAAEAPKA